MAVRIRGLDFAGAGFRFRSVSFHAAERHKNQKGLVRIPEIRGFDRQHRMPTGGFASGLTDASAAGKTLAISACGRLAVVFGMRIFKDFPDFIREESLFFV